MGQTPDKHGPYNILTEEEHLVVRDLIHFIDSGPGEGFASGAYREVLGGVFPSSVTWYTDSSKTQKIVELLITRDMSQKPTQEQWKLYDMNGVTVLVTATDTITYNGAFEATRTRVLT